MLQRLTFLNDFPGRVGIQVGEEHVGRPGAVSYTHLDVYKRQLRDCGLELPKHTFYVDNIFVYQPLPSVKSMYYICLLYTSRCV